VADYLGRRSLPPLDLDPSRPLWDQAARVAWDVVEAEEPVNLYAMHDEAEAEELLAAADRTPNPYAEAHEREAAELLAASLRRSARLFAALDGEELPADEEPVEEAVAEELVEDQDQEDEELVKVPLTPVQRRWLHTAAAHPAPSRPWGGPVAWPVAPCPVACCDLCEHGSPPGCAADATGVPTGRRRHPAAARPERPAPTARPGRAAPHGRVPYCARALTSGEPSGPFLCRRGAVNRAAPTRLPSCA